MLLVISFNETFNFKVIYKVVYNFEIIYINKKSLACPNWPERPEGSNHQKGPGPKGQKTQITKKAMALQTGPKGQRAQIIIKVQRFKFRYLDLYNPPTSKFANAFLYLVKCHQRCSSLIAEGSPAEQKCGHASRQLIVSHFVLIFSGFLGVDTKQTFGELLGRLMLSQSLSEGLLPFLLEELYGNGKELFDEILNETLNVIRIASEVTSSASENASSPSTCLANLVQFVLQGTKVRPVVSLLVQREDWLVTESESNLIACEMACKSYLGSFLSFGVDDDPEILSSFNNLEEINHKYFFTLSTHLLMTFFQSSFPHCPEPASSPRCSAAKLLYHYRRDPQKR